MAGYVTTYYGRWQPPEEIQRKFNELAKERAEARAIKDYKKSDELRDGIEALRYKVCDEPDGFTRYYR